MTELHHADSCGCSGPVETNAPIAITINPEARVNAARTTAPLPRLAPGQWHPFDITLINDGFVTGPLAIETTPIPGVDLDHLIHDLTGEPRQELTFQVRLNAPTTVDLPLTFRARTALGGLATHSTLNLLLRTT